MVSVCQRAFPAPLGPFLYCPVRAGGTSATARRRFYYFSVSEPISGIFCRRLRRLYSLGGPERPRKCRGGGDGAGPAVAAGARPQRRAGCAGDAAVGGDRGRRAGAAADAEGPARGGRREFRAPAAPQ